MTGRNQGNFLSSKGRKENGLITYAIFAYFVAKTKPNILEPQRTQRTQRKMMQ